MTHDTTRVGSYCSYVLTLSHQDYTDRGDHCIGSSGYSQLSFLCQLSVPGDSMYMTSGGHDSQPHQLNHDLLHHLLKLMLFYCNLIMLRFPPRPDPVE